MGVRSTFQLLRNIGLSALLVRAYRRIFFGSPFTWFERCGFHFLPVDYGSPVPDTRALRKRLPEWYRASELPGIEMRVEEQLSLLESLRAYHAEFPLLPIESELINSGMGLGFGDLEGHVLYAMVRHIRPRLIVEIGSGVSSVYSSLAIKKNESGQLVCIEPYPLPRFEAFVNEHHIKLLREPVESLTRSVLTELTSDNILFIDSSHILKLGNDVSYLYLEIIPRLKPGVLIHVHDIAFPFPCPDPEEWIFKRHQFWNESALLQALLCGNSHMRIVLSTSSLAYSHSAELKRAFPLYDPEVHRPTSIWIRVV
jgi:predicted O-methyltransferase YrrM